MEKMENEAINEVELKKMAEDEYLRLKGKFRHSELYVINYPTKLQAMQTKQRRIIKKLNEEKAELRNCITVSKSKSYRGLEESQLSQVFNNIEEEKKLEEEIANETSQIQDLRKEIDKIKKEIINFNKTDIHETKITESIMKSDKHIGDLEGKLQVATQKFSSLVAENANLRNKIEELLNERKTFYKNYMKLYKQLVNGKQIMLDIIEQTTTTYNQRGEAHRKLMSLKEKTAMEKKIQSKDVQELRRKVDNCEDLLDFLMVKGQKRVLADLVAREASEKEKHIIEMRRKLNMYSTVVKQIKDISDEDNLERFVRTFEKIEYENLGLLNLVNEMNDEVEVLQTQVSLLLEKIDDQRELNGQRSEQQLARIQQLQILVDKKRATYVYSEKKLEDSQTLLQDLLINLEAMFNENECDLQPILALLGNNAHINKYNVSLCLRLLEKQLYELIYVAYAKETNENFMGDVVIVQGDNHFHASKRPVVFHLCSTSPCPLCVETERIFILDENNTNDVIEGHGEAVKLVLAKIDEDPVASAGLLHNVSTCRLPRSRAIMQARFQEQEQSSRQ